MTLIHGDTFVICRERIFGHCAAAGDALRGALPRFVGLRLAVLLTCALLPR
jgi:hypothetical protein